MSIDFKSAPFDSAISYLENRIALPSQRWNDYQNSEADAIFWSAGAVDATLVSDLQKSVTRAIANGTPYDSPEFAAQIGNFSEQYGWDLKGGADWRARLILSQNLRQAYAAGRREQQYDPDVMKLQPYLQYVHSDSRAPRPAHLALDGKVFRKDDPIWGSITPPNGFNCGCYTVSLSQRQLDKKGLEIETIKLGDTLPYEDSNGITKQAIIKPDEGFNAAAGASSAVQRQAILERVKGRLPDVWAARIDNAIADSLMIFAAPKGNNAAIAKIYEDYKAQIEKSGKPPTEAQLERLEQFRQAAEGGKVAPKVEPKVEPKVTPKVEPKVTPKVEPKVEPKVTPKVEPKVEPKPSSEAQAKYENYKQIVGKVGKPTKQMLSKLEQLRIDAEGSSPQPKVAPKVEPKVEPKSEPKLSKEVQTIVTYLEQNGDRTEIEKYIFQASTQKSKIATETISALSEVLAAKFPPQPTHQTFVKQAESKYAAELKAIEKDGLKGAELILKRLIDESPLSRAEAQKGIAQITIIADPKQEKIVKEELEKFYLATGKVTPINEIMYTQRGAYSLMQSRKISLDSDYPEEIHSIWHEAAHLYEYDHADMSKASNEFVRSRANGHLQRLKEINPKRDYGDDESAYPDKFLNEYVGRVYLTSPKTTEVLSMGIETFSNPTLMADLYKQDPEHFKYILGLMHSK